MTATDPAGALAASCRLERVGPGRYARELDDTWLTGGTNLFGGYVIALGLAAMEAELADPERHPRSFTMHFLRPYQTGPCEIEVAVERSGRTVTTLSARVVGNGKLCGLALGSFSTDRPSPAFGDVAMPAVAPLRADETPLVPPAYTGSHARFEFFPRLGVWAERAAAQAAGADPGARGDAHEMVAGGWIRPRVPEPGTPGLLCAYADIWLPPVYYRFDTPYLIQTSDFTAHFRRRLPDPTLLAPGEAAFLLLRTASAGDGWVDEDAELWSPRGELLAHSRQFRAINTAQIFQALAKGAAGDADGDSSRSANRPPGFTAG